MAVDGDGVVTISAAQLGYLLGGHRLANAAEDLASDGGRLTILAYKSSATMIPSGCARITFDSLPSDLAAAYALILAERAARVEAERAQRALKPI